MFTIQTKNVFRDGAQLRLHPVLLPSISIHANTFDSIYCREVLYYIVNIFRHHSQCGQATQFHLMETCSGLSFKAQQLYDWPLEHRPFACMMTDHVTTHLTTKGHR